jgi:NAD-dependent dihydropyrimidine dehydrogenase PreA subunit
MTYVITEACGECKDGGCVAVCPCDAIHEGSITWQNQTIAQLFIDPSECIHCGLCEPECPVTAIYPEDELPKSSQAYKEINATFFRQRRR